MLTIDFYYFGYMCPYNDFLLQLLKELNSNDYQINLYDVTNQKDLARQVNLYSPQLFIFNNHIRWNGPITKKLIEHIKNGGIPKRKPYQVQIGTKVFQGEIQLLNEDTICFVEPTCSPDKSCCIKKGNYIDTILSEYALPHLGVIQLKQDQCVGGAEYLPLELVPYPIPHFENAAFLTCSYASDTEWDYRSYPLQILEEELKYLGFKQLIGIASVDVCFPNGPLSWFISRGYEDLGFVYYDEESHAKMHLIKKIL